MSEFGTAFANGILGYIRNGAAMPAHGALTLGLHNADPGPTGAANEITTTIRAGGRPGVSFGAPANRQMTNDAIVDFGASAGNVAGGGVTHYTLWMGATCVGVTPLAVAKTVAQGAPVSFPVGTVVLDLAFALTL